MTTNEITKPDLDADGLATALSHDELYAVVWAQLMLKVAARYKMSSSYMASVCSFLNVPRPARGYWAKLAVGKAAVAPPLPQPNPGECHCPVASRRSSEITTRVAACTLVTSRRKRKPSTGHLEVSVSTRRP
jgi:hypothetical protein